MTTSLLLVYKNHECKVAQRGTKNGMPSMTGCYVKNFIWAMHLQPGRWQLFASIVDQLQWISQEEYEESWRTITRVDRNYVRQEEYDNFCRQFPNLETEYASSILNTIVDELTVNHRPITHLRLKLYNALTDPNIFATSSWVYVIDLDTDMFEIYRGMNMLCEPEPNERFANIQMPALPTENYTGVRVYPPRLVMRYVMSESMPISDVFIGTINDREEAQIHRHKSIPLDIPAQYINPYVFPNTGSVTLSDVEHTYTQLTGTDTTITPTPTIWQWYRHST